MAPFIFDENDFLLPKMAIFVWSVKYTLVCKIHACHVTSLIKVPINFYCGGYYCAKLQLHTTCGC